MKFSIEGTNLNIEVPIKVTLDINELRNFLETSKEFSVKTIYSAMKYEEPVTLLGSR